MIGNLNDESCWETTEWHPDGSVRHQRRLFFDESGETVREQARESPPWWWGVTDQTEPTMPEWMKDDAKWQEALDSQR